MTTSRVPDLGSLSFWRIAAVPFDIYVAALDSWLPARPGGELWFGGSQLLAPMEYDRDLGTRRIQVRLARGPLHPPLRMRLDIDRIVHRAGAHPVQARPAHSGVFPGRTSPA
jgi:hypothetical protein